MVWEGFNDGYWSEPVASTNPNYTVGYWMGQEQVRIDEVEVKMDEPKDRDKGSNDIASAAKYERDHGDPDDDPRWDEFVR